MTTYVAFLRAINLGAKRRFGKDGQAAVTAAAGFTDVATHLNTGNVRLSTPMRSPARIERTLEAAYVEATGFEIPTVVLSMADLTALVRTCEEWAEGHIGKPHVSLLKASPSAEEIATLEARSTEHEQVRVRGRGALLLLGEQFHTSRLPAAVERHLGPATNRTLGVLSTLVEKWGH